MAISTDNFKMWYFSTYMIYVKLDEMIKHQKCSHCCKIAEMILCDWYTKTNLLKSVWDCWKSWAVWGGSWENGCPLDGIAVLLRLKKKIAVNKSTLFKGFLFFLFFEVMLVRSNFHRFSSRSLKLYRYRSEQPNWFFFDS